MVSEIKQEDLDSGKVVQNEHGTFWFKEPGRNVREDGWPIEKNLHRDNGLPAAIYADGRQEWWRDGDSHRENWAVIYTL